MPRVYCDHEDCTFNQDNVCRTSAISLSRKDLDETHLRNRRTTRCAAMVPIGNYREARWEKEKSQRTTPKLSLASTE